MVTSVSVFMPVSSPGAVQIKAVSVRELDHSGALVKGRSGGLLSGGDVHSAWFRHLANIVVSRGHNRWCPAYVESKQASLSTTEVTRTQCMLCLLPAAARQRPDVSSCGSLAQGRDAESILDVAGSRDAWTSGAGAVPLKSTQMMGQQQHKR